MLMSQKHFWRFPKSSFLTLQLTVFEKENYKLKSIKEFFRAEYDWQITSINPLIHSTADYLRYLFTHIFNIKPVCLHYEKYATIK